jgi:hypothetical protein
MMLPAGINPMRGACHLSKASLQKFSMPFAQFDIFSFVMISILHDLNGTWGQRKTI